MAEKFILVQSKDDKIPTRVTETAFNKVWKSRGYSKVNKTDEEKAREAISQAGATGASNSSK